MSVTDGDAKASQRDLLTSQTRWVESENATPGSMTSKPPSEPHWPYLRPGCETSSE